jgi:hypothetical protein
MLGAPAQENREASLAAFFSRDTQVHQRRRLPWMMR